VQYAGFNATYEAIGRHLNFICSLRTTIYRNVRSFIFSEADATFSTAQTTQVTCKPDLSFFVIFAIDSSCCFQLRHN